MSIKPISRDRRRAYRSRHRTSVGWGGKVAIIVVTCAILLFAVAVMLGNFLRSQVETPVDSSSGEDGSGEISHLSPAPAIIARSVTLQDVLAALDSGATAPLPSIGASSVPESSSVSAETSAGSSSDTSSESVSSPEDVVLHPVTYNAVSIVVRVKNESVSGGTMGSAGSVGSADSAGSSSDTHPDTSKKYRLIYSSEASRACHFDALGERELADVVSGLKLLSDHVSAVFEVSYPESPASTRSILREYELSLLAELLSAGIDDVVLCGFGTSHGELTEAAGFVEELISRTNGAGKVGIAFDFDFFDGNVDEVSDKIRTLSTGNVFVALDLWHINVPELMSPEDVISDRISRCSELLQRYLIRIVVGCGGDRADVSADPAALDRQIRAALSAGAQSVQAVKVVSE